MNDDKTIVAPRYSPLKHGRAAYIGFFLLAFAGVSAGSMMIEYWNVWTTASFLAINLGIVVVYSALLLHNFFCYDISFSWRKAWGGDYAGSLNDSKHSPDLAKMRDSDIRRANNQWHYTAVFLIFLSMLVFYSAFLGKCQTASEDFQPMPVVYNAEAQYKYDTMKKFEAAMAFACFGVLAFIMLETHSSLWYNTTIGIDRDMRGLWGTEKVPMFDGDQITEEATVVQMQSNNPNNVLLCRKDLLPTY